MDKRVLSFQGGCFSVMQLTDIHYTHDDEADHRTLLLMRELIAAEKPGLIVLTGDTVYGERNAELLAKALSPVTESGIPWAFLFGNHDVEFAGTRGELFSQAVRRPGSSKRRTCRWGAGC